MMPKHFVKELVVVITVLFTTMTVFASEESLADALVAYATSDEFLDLPYCWGAPQQGSTARGLLSMSIPTLGLTYRG